MNKKIDVSLSNTIIVETHTHTDDEDDGDDYASLLANVSCINKA